MVCFWKFTGILPEMFLPFATLPINSYVIFVLVRNGRFQALLSTCGGKF